MSAVALFLLVFVENLLLYCIAFQFNMYIWRAKHKNVEDSYVWCVFCFTYLCGINNGMYCFITGDDRNVISVCLKLNIINHSRFKKGGFCK